MKEVTFLKKCLYGDKGETRLVTDRAALQYAKIGLIKEDKELEIKEEKEELETKEEKEVIETKSKKAKITKSPKF